MEYLIGVVVLAIVAKFAYDQIKKDKAEGGEQKPEAAPEWFSAKSYLSSNPDVAAANLNPWRHYIDYGRAEQRPPYFGVDGDVQAVNQPPFRRMIVQTDYVGSHTSDKGGDFNEPNDTGDMLAVFQEHNFRPLSFIASYNTEMVGLDALKQLVMESGLDIPVLPGNKSFKPGASLGSQYIADESKKGKLDLIWGGPLNDLRDAKRLGAEGKNIKLWVIGAGTWNAWTDPATQDDTLAATAEVYAWLGKNIFDVKDYRNFLTAPYGKSDKSVNWNKDWIQRVRAVSRLARMGYNDFISSKNAAANKTEAGPNPIRVADIKCLMWALGINTDPSNYINFKNNVVLKGFKGLEARPKLTRLSEPSITVGKPVKEESRAPITAADFDMTKVDMNGFSLNPLKMRETSRITSAKVSLTKSSVNHTEKNVWPSVRAEHEGRLIDVNCNVTMFYVENGKTKGMPFEYLRPGQTDMHAGAAKASPSIRKGDLVKIVVSYIYRRGDHARNQGTDKRRTNVFDVVVS